MIIKEKLRIALYLPSFAGGGAEKIMILFANYLAKLDHDVIFIVCRNEGIRKNDLDSSVKIISLNKRNVWVSILKLSKIIIEIQPNVAISSMVHTNISLGISSIFTNIKTIYREANTLSVELNKSGRFKKTILKILVNYFYNRSPIIAVSNGVAVDLEKYFKVNKNIINVIYNPAPNVECYKKLKEKPTSTEIKRIVTFGRIVEQKNHRLLIEAFEHVLDEIPSTLEIYGDGPDLPSLISLVKKLGLINNIEFKGYVKNADKFLIGADLFVLSSNYEGFPNVILEALAYGTPVVSTDCPSGPREILGDSKFGKLVPCDDPAKLSDAIIKMLKKPTAKDVCIKRASQFSEEETLKKYYSLIKPRDN